MHYMLLKICRKTHEKYVVESRAERHKKEGKFVVYIHESNRLNFVTISRTAVRLC